MAKNDNPETRSGNELLKKAKKAYITPERSNYQRTWALLTEFMLPNENRGWFEDPSKGVRRDRRVFDSTAIQANRDLASAMHSTITNPALDWSKIRFKDDDLNEDHEALEWVEHATKVFHDTLTESNFDSQVGRGYLCYAGLGNMILYMDDDFNFTCWGLQEVAFVENHRGIVDTAYRRFKMTVKALYDQFGEAIGEELCRRLESSPLDELQVYHCIYPREKDEVKLNPLGLGDGKDRPYASIYILEKGAKILEEDGHYEFPVYVARWSQLPGENYGFGPGHSVIADVRSLNKIKEEALRGLAKAVNPPIITTKQNVIAGDLRPGGQVSVRDFNSFKEFVTQSRFDAVKLETQDLQASIKGAFYIDKLLLPPRQETGEMTAYEVAQRLEQMQQILGPVLSKLNAEFLTPLVIRSIKALMRKGRIKPIPTSVLSKIGKKGKKSIDLDIAFINSLARSQQMDELRNVQQWIQETAAMAQIKPEVLDNIDIDKVVSYAARIRNVPESFLVAAEQVKQIRQQRQQQQQQAQMVQNLQASGSAAQSFAQAHATMNPPQSTTPPQ